MPLPPLDPDGPPKPRLAPPWVALLAAQLGLLTLLASAAVPFLPGSRDPRAELQNLRPYSAADRFIPVPLYACAVALFLGIVVLLQMRREARPLPDALVAQRVQAWAGIVLALLGAAIIYLHGQPAEIADGTTVAQLIAQHNFTPQKVAVELNRRLIRADKYDTLLKAGDEVEIVTFVGGG